MAVNAYIYNYLSGFVVVNTVSHAIVGTFTETLDDVSYLVGAPNGRFVYATNKVSSVGLSSASLAVTPDSKKLYVTPGNTDLVEVLDARTFDELGSIAVGQFSIGVTVTPDGRFAYASTFNPFIFPNTSSIRVIDTASNSIIATIAGTGVVRSPFLLATPDSRFVYVPNLTGVNTISVIDTTSNIVATIINDIWSAYTMVITPDGKTIYVFGTNEGVTEPLLFVIDTASNSVTTTISGFINPGIPAITPDGKTIWVPGTDAETANGLIYLVSTESNTIEGDISLGATSLVVPTAVAIIKTSGAPPTRQKPRDDNLALGAVRQRVGKGQPSSVQNSYRQGFAGTYS
jgi:DNA-binding beta-propeller fold protein YncE